MKYLYLINIFIGLLFWFLAQFISNHILGAGKHQILDILFKNGSVTPLQTILRFIGPLLLSLAGSAGGLFAPSLSAGVVGAAFISQITHSGSTNLLALVGMISFLTGFMRVPFTAFILVMEMTDRRTALVPMMLGALIAHGVSKMVSSESFYDFVKHRILKRYNVT